ncbi:LrgA [Pseudomonas aeruginosa VRFPA06]|nr:CidA/LrgA family protein [Pseudomonas aeruginosa]ETD89037.1 LrgA [Pseudomonas aeruginosa VRFPA06]
MRTIRFGDDRPGLILSPSPISQPRPFPCCPRLVRRLSRLAAELAVLIAFWWAGGWLAKAIGLPLPGGVVGLAALLLLFASGLLRPAWLQAGAGLLLAEMLLFFIPALMSLLDYGALLRSEGWRILLVIMLSTLLVMLVTAVSVEWMCRWRARHESR